MTLYCELFDTRPADSACAQMCREVFLMYALLAGLSSVSLLLPTEGSVQRKRIGGGIRQFDKVDLV